MITKHFKALLSVMLQANTGFGMVACKDTGGNTVYAAGMFTSSNFPAKLTTTLTTSATDVGIVLGSGTTPATENDYRIETPVTGVSASISGSNSLISGNPARTYTIEVTNNNASSVTISEVAYIQKVSCANTLESSTTYTKNVCFDRTLLSSPVTIGAGETKTIAYTLTTLVS